MNPAGLNDGGMPCVDPDAGAGARAQIAKSAKNIDISMLGKAQKVIATKDDTTIVGGKGKKKEIEARIAQIKLQIEKSESDYDKEKLQKRAAKLTGGVAVIKVGAATETELTYMKHKMEDALAATRAAVEEGIVAGGGTALAKAAASFAGKKSQFENNEYRAGYETLLKALEEPLRQSASNFGKKGPAVVLNKVIEENSVNFGYNAEEDKFEIDMINGDMILFLAVRL